MKIKLTTIGLILGSFNAFSQVTITSATFQPTANETFSYSNVNSSINPGAAGANVTWDFSMATSNGALSNYYVTNCNGNGDCASYPGASYYIGNNGLNSKTFYINDATGLQENGIYANNVSTVYSDPQMVLKFPVTYNQTFTDNFAFSAVLSGINQSATGTANVSVDGYGTLKTPTATFTGVLRVKSLLNQVVVVNGTSTPQVIESYSWFKPNVAHELMTIISTTVTTPAGPVGNTVAYYINSGSGGNTAVNDINNTTVQLNVFPNPAQASFKIDVVGNAGAHNVMVRDLLGKTMFSQMINISGNKNNTIDVNTSGWAKGIYLVEVSGADRSSVQKIVVE